MQNQKKTSHSKYIIGINAYFIEDRVVKGVKQVGGGSAGGFVTVGKIRVYDTNGLSTDQFVTNIEQARKAANYFWRFKFVGLMKQIWIKEEGVEVAFHSNFEFKKQKNGTFSKDFIKNK